jgi:hypothetical protein
MIMIVGGKKKFQRNVQILGILLLIVLLIAWLFPEIFATAWRRMMETDSFSNRDVLLVFYFKHILSSVSNLLYGIGAQSLPDKIFDIYGYRYDMPHNSVQEVWCAWGLVGVIMLGYLLYHLVRRSKFFAGEGRRSYHYLPLVVLLTSSMAGHLITSGRSLMLLVFSYLCLCIPVSEQAPQDPPSACPAENASAQRDTN